MKNVLGLDIGGTKITGIIWNGKKIVSEITIQTAPNLQEFEYRLYKLVDLLKKRYKIEAVGVACAGVIDVKNGKVLHSPNLLFLDGFSFKRFFLQKLSIKKIFCDNDVNCFTRAELRVGAGRRFKNFTGVAFGTGIGAGLVIEGKLYRGAHHSGSEFGHLVTEKGETWEKLYQRARDKRDFVTLGKILGRVLANIYNAVDPEAIILGGSVVLKEGPKFLSNMKKETHRHLLNKKLRPNILVSKLKHAGAIGAALLIE